MSLTSEQVKKIAHLARLGLPSENIQFYATQLSQILEFIEQMNKIDTAEVAPLAHPLDTLSQRLRSDIVTEPDKREEYERLAPQVEAGLYLVPKVIE